MFTYLSAAVTNVGKTYRDLSIKKKEHISEIKLNKDNPKSNLA